MRSNDRLPNQISTIACTTGLLHQADGSSKFALGKSEVIAGVFGPIATPIKLEKIDSAEIIVTLDPLSGTSGTFERLLSVQIRNSLMALIDVRLFPRSCIQVNLQILSQDGLILPVAVNAAVLACVDAGIPMSGMMGAISVCVSSKGEILLDPDQEEVEAAVSRHTFAFQDKSGELILQDSWGRFSIQDDITRVGKGVMSKDFRFYESSNGKKISEIVKRINSF